MKRNSNEKVDKKELSNHPGVAWQTVCRSKNNLSNLKKATSLQNSGNTSNFKIIEENNSDRDQKNSRQQSINIFASLK